MSGASTAVPVKQIAVEAIVWRARPCLNHEEFTAECQTCLDGTHCLNHEGFDGECGDCQACKTPHDLGTIAHFHENPDQQAYDSLLSKGLRFWRRD